MVGGLLPAHSRPYQCTLPCALRVRIASAAGCPVKRGYELVYPLAYVAALLNSTPTNGSSPTTQALCPGAIW